MASTVPTKATQTFSETAWSSTNFETHSVNQKSQSYGNCLNKTKTTSQQMGRNFSNLCSTYSNYSSDFLFPGPSSDHTETAVLVVHSQDRRQLLTIIGFSRFLEQKAGTYNSHNCTGKIDLTAIKF